MCVSCPQLKVKSAQLKAILLKVRVSLRPQLEDLTVVLKMCLLCRQLKVKSVVESECVSLRAQLKAKVLSY